MKVTEITKMNETEGGERMKRLIKDNKGFSLVELLIVIAIMGVLAVIAFNMFGGVLGNTKEKADIQQATNIGKALTTFCQESGDWGLAGLTISGSAITAMNNPEQAVQALMSEITYDGKTYGPYLSRKDPALAVGDPVNMSQFIPQYLVGKGGKNVGWEITVYTKQGNVKCVPSTTTSNAAITFPEGK